MVFDLSITKFQQTFLIVKTILWQQVLLCCKLNLVSQSVCKMLNKLVVKLLCVHLITQTSRFSVNFFQSSIIRIFVRFFCHKMQFLSRQNCYILFLELFDQKREKRSTFEQNRISQLLVERVKNTQIYLLDNFLLVF